MATEENKQASGAHGLTITLLIASMIYFLCPIALLMPLAKMAKVAGVPTQHREKLLFPFFPVIYLADKFPAYMRFIEAETELAKPFFGAPFD